MAGTPVTSFGSEAGAFDSTGRSVTALSTTASNGQAITLTLEAGCTVKYETGASDWTLAHTQVVSDGSSISIGNHSSSHWTIIQIIAEDSTETVIVIK